MFLQVSKISHSGFIIFTLLFQQFIVGSEVFAISVPVQNGDYKDIFLKPDTIKIVSDSIKVDSTVSDTNVSKDEVLKFPVKYHARDSMRVNIEDQIVYLFGAATVDYDDMHMKADYIVIDMNNKELYAEGVADSTGRIKGSPEFAQGAQQFRSSTIRYNFDTRKGKIANVITQEGDGYIHGEVVKKDPDNNFYIKKGQYTTCELDTPHFAITSNRLKVINNSKIVTGPAYLTIENVPTPLLIPFGFFPNKKGRSSGIIFPSFGESAERGFYFQHLGYYFGFSDYVTLALTTDVYAKGSYTLDASSIYKKRYKYNGNVFLSYAYTINSEIELPDYSVTKDFRINWRHTQDPKLNPNSNFSANVNLISGSYFTNTISSATNFLSNTFQSSISYSHSFPGKPINLSVGATHSQNTITRDIRIATPDVSFNVSRINPFQRKNVIGKLRWYEKIGTSYSMRGTNFIETKDTLLFSSESINQFQNGIQHVIPFSTSFNVMSYFNLSPSFNYTERWYFKTLRMNWDPDSQKVDTFEVEKFKSARDYQASIGLSTRIYGMYLFKGGPVAALRHVMTPSVSMTFRPDFSNERYGYYGVVQSTTSGDRQTYSIFQNTVYGGPAAGRYANLGFSLDNNLEMKVKTKSDTGETLKKVKILESLSLSSGYNIIADSMKLALISVGGRTTIFDKVSINFGGVLDPYEFDANNNDYDKFTVSDGGPLVRLTSASASANFSLNPSKLKTNPKYSEEELDYINNHPEEYIDFDIPYNVSVGYTYSYSKRGNEQSIISQSASINGDLNLTPQWKIGFNSWYDFSDGRFTNLGLNIYRDLHCWEMRLNWIPFGYQESWNFQINVKSSILQDLKLSKKKDYFDR